MENTLKRTDLSQITACKIEREPDGTILIRYVEAPPLFLRRLYYMFAIGATLFAILIMTVGGSSFSDDFKDYGFIASVSMLGIGLFVLWFVYRWAPHKFMFDSNGNGKGKLRIVPDVGFKLSKGNLPFEDILKFISGYEEATASYDIRAVTNSGTHTIASCTTEVGYRSLMAALQKEGVVAD
ncbi:MAG: hypothetical protein ACYC4K_09190 [Thiobacillus sp.]